ncbi:MAG TPA: folylpolyglutamate synthase/dihydrofolate synthase family protein [Polyangiaceae bacterium]|nr:folylpolyglutamate synthase/dihydrofolate synthase family protein [Polyangiaceae bacterium]
MSETQATLARLYQRAPRGGQLGLERMQAACDAFGNPERSFAAVHVAGTNGKGTVCALTATMLRAHGKKVGLYTSPHLCRFSERIVIDGAPIDDAELASILNEVLEKGPDLTFFEVATLAAFVAFQRAKVEIAVLEVGLGGRLDATNVIPPPEVACITRIAFDHMADLGDTLAKIGGEKAGIIKKGTHVVLGKIHPDAREVIERRIAEVGATQLELGEPEPYPGAQLAYPRVAMFGTNLAVATTVARHFKIAPEVMAQGIEETSWPGRNELLHRGGQELTLLDCAHNADGAVMLSHVVEASLAEAIGNRRNVALVFGTKQDKNWKAMLDRLSNCVGHRVFVAPPISNAAAPQEMAKQFPGEVAPDIATALARARELVGSRGLVVVSGSIFLVGAARAALLAIQCDPAIDL